MKEGIAIIMVNHDNHNTNEMLEEWAEQLYAFTLPRWEDFPSFDIYIDQVLTLMNDYLAVFKIEGEETLTKSMINNYVKEGMIPKPVNKKYNRYHLAYLLAITILKHVASISEIKQGIIYQAKISGGASSAYELFCQEQEYALRRVSRNFLSDHSKEINSFETKELHGDDHLSLVRNATTSIATKVTTKKIIEVIYHEEVDVDE